LIFNANVFVDFLSLSTFDFSTKRSLEISINIQYGGGIKAISRLTYAVLLIMNGS